MRHNNGFQTNYPQVGSLYPIDMYACTHTHMRMYTHTCTHPHTHPHRQTLLVNKHSTELKKHIHTNPTSRISRNTQKKGSFVQVQGRKEDIPQNPLPLVDQVR